MPNTASSSDGTTLELYKLSVEMADRTSARRLATNTFFLTLHSALAVIVGVIGSVRDVSNKHFDPVSLLTLAVVGVVLSVAWWGLLRYYRRLNRAKFEVINAMEANFPVKPFTEEWEVLHPPLAPGAPPLRWYQLIKRAHRSHREATLVEQIVPIVFAAIYLVLGIRVWSA